jgi:uncharacterized protein YcgI (DUF1989 family)
MAQSANVTSPTRRMIADDLIPAGEGGAWLVNRGQHIRVIDVEGGQICDFVCFNASAARGCSRTFAANTMEWPRRSRSSVRSAFRHSAVTRSCRKR